MDRAGTVVRTAQGLAICRCPDDSHPGIGPRVVDEQLDAVGRIVDVFGPVDRPYLSISPVSGRSPPDLLGDTLYVR